MISYACLCVPMHSYQRRMFEIKIDVLEKSSKNVSVISSEIEIVGLANPNGDRDNGDSSMF